MNRGRFRLRLVLVGAVAALLAWLGSSAIVAWRLTHRASPLRVEPIPALIEGRAEVLAIHTRDGERLGAWYFPCAHPRAAVLVLHGHGGSRTALAELEIWLSEQGLAVLAPSLRAHGDSTGTKNDFGWGSREDVLACVGELEKRAPGVPIVVYGSSLGAAAAIYAAGELGPRVAGYALEAPYRDIRTATRHRLGMVLPLGLDRLAYAGLALFSGAMLEPDLDLLAPIDRVGDIPVDLPVVFLSGTADRHAPAAEVEEIRARCRGPATIALFPGASHDVLWAHDPARFRSTLLDLVEAAVSRGERSRGATAAGPGASGSTDGSRR